MKAIGYSMNGYIKELRRLVGKRALIQTGAGVIAENDRGEVLLGRRTDNRMWGYFGGSVEIDEAVEDCARRELFEEAGIAADELELFTVFSGPGAHYVYPNGDEVSNIDIVYLCRRWHGEPRPQPEEMKTLAFFAPCDVPKEISPPLQEVMKRYLKRRGIG